MELLRYRKNNSMRRQKRGHCRARQNHRSNNKNTNDDRNNMLSSVSFHTTAATILVLMCMPVRNTIAFVHPLTTTTTTRGETTSSVISRTAQQLQRSEDSPCFDIISRNRPFSSISLDPSISYSRILQGTSLSYSPQSTATFTIPSMSYHQSSSSSSSWTKNNIHTISSSRTSLQQHESFSSSLYSFGNLKRKLTLLSSVKDTVEAESSTDNDAGDSDETEWSALLSGFQMYKAAYGDLKVPSRFVVPSMPPWPEPAWGMKLGQKVAAIRSTGKYIQNDEQRRKVLEDLGFLWRLRAARRENKMDGISFEQVFDALQTYRQEVQPSSSPEDSPLQIPENFVVPDCEPWPENTRGLPLGKKIPTIRSKSYLKANPGATEKLKELGFQFDGKVAANDARFNRVYTGLVRYKEINGDLLVPQPFVIPENDDQWEEDLWGLRLGARVNAIRSQGTFIKTDPSRKTLLDELGFVWELPTADNERKRGRKKKVELEALNGAAAAGILSSIDQGASPPGQMGGDPLLAGGLLSDPYNMQASGSNRSPQWTIDGEFSQADQQQQQQDVEYKPAKDFAQTNEEMQKMAIDVGVLTSVGENDRLFKGKIDVKVPWFNDDFGGDFVFEDVVEAYTVYKSIYGDFENLEEDFVVPDPPASSLFDEEESFAREMEQMGMTEMPSDGGDMSARIVTQQQQQNEEEPDFEDDLANAIAAAMDDGSESSGDLDTSSPWPEHLAGMNLGSITKRIQEGDLEVKHLPERKEQLDALDFDWGDEKLFLDVPFDKAMCAMFAYYMIRGDLFVYEDFIMPNEEPWPRALAGFELGKAVFRLRAKQNFLEEYYPKKKYLLNMLEFVWFPLDALPLDPDAPPLSWEQEHVKHIGHPLARISAPPFSAVEHVHPVDHPESQDRYEFDFELVRRYYVDELGVTDIGEFLRDRGFYQLADEHEAKYGKKFDEPQSLDEQVEVEDEYEEEEEEEEEEEDGEWEYEDEEDEEEYEEEDWEEEEDDDEEEDADEIEEEDYEE